jgi:hypothetical protein
LICALAHRAGAQGRHGSNAEIVAIDPPTPVTFCPAPLAVAALVAAGDSDIFGAGGFWGQLRKEVGMIDPARRAKLQRELEQDFIPDYDAATLPSADKRTAYALEHIAFRVGRIEQSLARIAAAIESVLAKR